MKKKKLSVLNMVDGNLYVNKYHECIVSKHHEMGITVYNLDRKEAYIFNRKGKPYILHLFREGFLPIYKNEFTNFSVDTRSKRSDKKKMVNLATPVYDKQLTYVEEINDDDFIVVGVLLQPYNPTFVLSRLNNFR